MVGGGPHPVEQQRMLKMEKNRLRQTAKFVDDQLNYESKKAKDLNKEAERLKKASRARSSQL